MRVLMDRYLRKAQVGVMIQLPDRRHNVITLDRQLVGTVRRSGTVKEMGHFCYIHCRYAGKWRWAGGAEDRIHPFHSIELEVGETPNELDLVALGWVDGNQYAFFNRQGQVVDCYGIELHKDRYSPAGWPAWPLLSCRKWDLPFYREVVRLHGEAR